MADVAELVFNIDSTQARGAAKVLADFNSAAIKAANGASKFEKTMRGADGRFRSTAKYVEDNRREVEQLAQAYNPVLAAQIRYRDESIKTGAAVKAGVITEQQRVEILQRTRTALDASAAAASRFGQSQDVARHHVANLSFQLNDIGMMMATGQNPFMLMMQQGPQVAQIFSQMNQEGRKLGPTLAGAFRMFLNPTTAVTLAVIGLTAALGQMATGAFRSSDSVKTVTDALDRLDDELSKVERSNKSLIALAKGGGLEELRSKYGAITKEVRAMIAAQNELDRIAARSAQRAAQEMLESSIGSGFWANIFDNGRVAITEMDRDAVKLEQTIRYLQNTLGVTDSNAEGLARTLQAAFDQKDPAEYARLVGHVRDYLLLVAQAGGKGADEALRLAQELTKSEEAARRVNAQANNMPGAFSAAAASAARITDELNRAVSAARNLAMSGLSDLRRTQIELEFRGDAVGMAGALAAEQFDMSTVTEGFDAHLVARQRQEVIQTAIETAKLREQIVSLDEAEREAERNRKKADRSGGSAAKAAERRAASELKAAEKGFQNIRELLEKESLFQIAEWEKRQNQLDIALAKDLVTRENYEIMKQQLQQAYFGTEYERKQLQYNMDLEQLRAALDAEMVTRQQYAMMAANIHSQKLTSLGDADANIYSQHLSNLAGHFGEMNAIAGGGYDSLLKAQRVFGAASALISTYTGAAEALKLPFPYNIAAAAKVLATGMGFVNAIKSGGSSKSSGGGSASSAAVKQEPTRNVLVRMEGPEWMQDIAESVITQIYDSSKDGRVIIARDY